MKKILFAIVLCVPFLAHAEEEGCRMEVGYGRIHVNSNFKKSATEERIEQTAGVSSTRMVVDSSRATEFSVGCALAPSWRVRLAYLNHTSFSVTNTVSAPMNVITDPELQNIVGGSVSAVVTRRAEVRAIGILPSYYYPVTERFRVFAEGGAYHVEADLASEALFVDDTGKSVTLLGPKETRTGWVPALMVGADYRLTKGLDLIARVLPLEKVNGYFLAVGARF